MQVSVPKHVFLSEPCHLRALASDLTAAFEVERTRGAILNNRQDIISFKRLNDRVVDLLKGYSLAGNGDWRQYAAWNDQSYLRHLLLATEEFEIMLLCWRPGQTSRVHTHADSHCWFAVLAGEVRETQYRPFAGEEGVSEASLNAAGGAMDLVPTKIINNSVGDVGYINDRIAMHSVGCCPSERPNPRQEVTSPEENGMRTALACTLHIYSPPIRSAKALEDGKFMACIPGFFSRHCILTGSDPIKHAAIATA
ncbi:hypothetical protein Vretimale_4382 [Volvox reticuliferus]|uniref:Cysteine dioxygenase n=1 Tax=Volvox reticuliferus TaxID=1737510 RepID=A0A8J4C1I3_9CHLO|nr:hypothetical protein Vretifemale_2976 [Volvox reticuliferus]GIL99117.1 hypothetical protein Vretimale_4382 [Volvox reticuliferus]